MARITEEPLQTTSEFSTTLDKESNRISQIQKKALLRQMTSQGSDHVESQPNTLGSVGSEYHKPPRKSSAVVIIDDDDEDEDSDGLFERDENCTNDDDICLDDQISIVPRQQPSIIVFSDEGRPSDLFEEHKVFNNGQNGGFEPLEAITPNDDHSQIQPRFSTVMSDRDSSNILSRPYRGQAFFLQPSFSQAVPQAMENNYLTEPVAHGQREFRPSTNIVQNQLPSLSMSMSIPPNFELGQVDSDAAIDENVGEESKEGTLSRTKRVRGPTFVRRGQFRAQANVEDLDASALEPSSDDEAQEQPVMFDSRQRIEETSDLPPKMKLLSAGNQKLEKPAIRGSVGLSMLDEDSVNTPADG